MVKLHGGSKNLLGNKYEYLTVINYGKWSRHGHYWLVKCVCGKEKLVLGRNLREGHAQSCGCMTRKIMREKAQKPVDLSGKKFGILTAVKYVGSPGNNKWLVRCDCGNEKIVITNVLKRSHSCGCLTASIKRQKMMDDLTGMKFGDFEVIELDDSIKRDKLHWMCKCKCGVIKSVCGSFLKLGKTKSCGGHRETHRDDLVGMRFGDLVVVKLSDVRDGVGYWECKCDCGNVKVIAGKTLKKNNCIKSCGCKHGKRTHGLSNKPKEYHKHLMNDPFKKLRLRVSVSVNRSLKSRSSTKRGSSILKFLPFTIQQLKEHLESQFESWMNWDNYGGRTDDKRKTWHMDHIVPHSNFRYTSMSDQAFVECWALSNLRPLEKIENMSKGARCHS